MLDTPSGEHPETFGEFRGYAVKESPHGEKCKAVSFVDHSIKEHGGNADAKPSDPKKYMGVVKPLLGEKTE